MLKNYNEYWFSIKNLPARPPIFILCYFSNFIINDVFRSSEEKDKWMEDLQRAIAAAKDKGEDKVLYPSLKSNSSSDNLEDMHDEPKTPSPEKQIQHRANTTMHVCWHRNTSVSMRDHSIAVEVNASFFMQQLALQ